MKHNIIFLLLSALLTVLGAAVPLNKRQNAYSTTTEIIIDTIWSTTTIWVPSSAATGGYNNNNNVVTSTSQTPSSSAAPPPPPPPPPTTTSTYVPPAVTTSNDPPTPTYVPPPVTTTAAPYVAPAPANPAPADTSTSGSSYGSTQGQYTGDVTYYDVSVGLGSCGWQGTNSQNLVAVAADTMQNGANPNSNPLCGKKINIYYNGNVHQGTIYDTCPTCYGGSLDLTQTLFQQVAPNGDGRVHGVSWSFA